MTEVNIVDEKKGSCILIEQKTEIEQWMKGCKPCYIGSLIYTYARQIMMEAY